MIGGLFVDGASVIHSLNHREVNGVKERLRYDLLEEHLKRRLAPDDKTPLEFRFKHYYGAHRNTGDLAIKENFYNSIKRMGWTVYEIQAKQYPDGHFEDKQVDISIALDVYHLALLKQIDVVVILTHDSDFAALFKRISPKIRKVIVGWGKGMASELDQVAEPIFFENIWNEVREAR